MVPNNYKNSTRSTCARTCSRTCSPSIAEHCDEYLEMRDGIVTDTDSYSGFEKIRKDFEKIKIKEPFDRIMQKKNWKRIQKEHSRRKGFI